MASAKVINEPTPPPDGGYGWVVVAAVFGITSLSLGSLFCVIGVVFDLLVDDFDCMKSEVSAVGSIAYCLNCLLGPLVSIIMKRFSLRMIVFFGSFLCGLSLILSAFSTSIFVLFFTFGIIGGVGMSMIYLPVNVIIAFYFHRRRTVASALGIVGSFVGTFVFPYLFQFLIPIYGWRGTFFIMAAILFNSMGFSLLLHPVEKTCPPPAVKYSASSNRLEVFIAENIAGCKPMNSVPENLNAAESEPNLDTAACILPPQRQPILSAIPPHMYMRSRSMSVSKLKDAKNKPVLEHQMSDERQNGILRQKPSPPKFSISFDQHRQTKSTGNARGHYNKKRSESTIDNSFSRFQMSSFTNLYSTPAIISVSSIPDGMDDVTVPVIGSVVFTGPSRKHHNTEAYSDGSDLSSSQRASRQCSRGSTELKTVTEENDGSSLGLKKGRSFVSPLAYGQQGSTTNTNIVEEVLAKQKSVDKQSRRSKLFTAIKPYFVHFQKLSYSILVAINLLKGLVFYVPGLFIVHWGNELGFSDNQTIFLLSLIGIGNAIGRPLTALLSDLMPSRRMALLAATFLINGLVTMGTVAINNFFYVAFFAFQFGFFIGGGQTIQAPAVADLVPLNEMAHAYGVFISAEGVGYLLGPPILGLFKYSVTFGLAGVIMVLAALLLIIAEFYVFCVKKSDCYKQPDKC